MGMHSCNQVLSASMGFSSSSVSEADLLTGDAVAVVTISGTIQYDGTTASPEGLKAVLDEAETNPHVKALVLRVDSGGGTATAGEEMAAYLKEFSKPVVVSSASMNASAAYEISSQADYIFTAKTTAIGAIGTAMQITDTSELMDKLGINIENITSSDSKDSSYGTRPLTDEERAYYQQMVDDINETFIQNVAEGRGMTTDEVRALATGLTFTGMDAVENGLADEIGLKEDAIAKAAQLAGLSDYEVVSLDPETDDLYELLGMLSATDGSAAASGAADEREGETLLER
ncbi:MAG TPA: signal peptide peptidase SppA [Candidatus Aphodovivens avistercoris]|nr:signal peptide peptidase SppA [Candidatus Aphodovivens avistercoris]